MVDHMGPWLEHQVALLLDYVTLLPCIYYFRIDDDFIVFERSSASVICLACGVRLQVRWLLGCVFADIGVFFLIEGRLLHPVN